MEKPNPQPVKLEGCLSQIWNFSTGELLNTTQKHNCSDYGCPVLTIATIVLRIFTEIENLKLRACIQVSDYINNTKMEQIIWMMVKSIHESFQEFISEINNGFIGPCWRILGPLAYERRYSTDTRTEPMHWVLSPLALSLRIELMSAADCKHVYKDCIASLMRFLKLSLHHSIVNITEFHLDSDYDLCITWH